jgi:hypothetical protein
MWSDEAAKAQTERSPPPVAQHYATLHIVPELLSSTVQETRTEFFMDLDGSPDDLSGQRLMFQCHRDLPQIFFFMASWVPHRNELSDERQGTDEAYRPPIAADKGLRGTRGGYQTVFSAARPGAGLFGDPLN